MNAEELQAIRERYNLAADYWSAYINSGRSDLKSIGLRDNLASMFYALDISDLLSEVDCLTAQIATDARIISEQARQIEALVCELATAQERMIGTARVLSTIHAVPDVNPQAGEGE